MGTSEFLRTESDYNSALSRIDELIAKNPVVGSKDFIELDQWGTLVCEYEDIHFPIEE
ncbi:MAG: transcriptional regulator [Bacteroidetes bacterium]|nr:transcriptional regulator [Bacteroidota bacterium]